VDTFPISDARRPKKIENGLHNTVNQWAEKILLGKFAAKFRYIKGIVSRAMHIGFLVLFDRS
jgi:hypothetical protein